MDNPIFHRIPNVISNRYLAPFQRVILPAQLHAINIVETYDATKQ